VEAKRERGRGGRERERGGEGLRGREGKEREGDGERGGGREMEREGGGEGVMERGGRCFPLKERRKVKRIKLFRDVMDPEVGPDEEDVLSSSHGSGLVSERCYDNMYRIVSWTTPRHVMNLL